MTISLWGAKHRLSHGHEQSCQLQSQGQPCLQCEVHVPRPHSGAAAICLRRPPHAGSIQALVMCLNTGVDPVPSPLPSTGPDAAVPAACGTCCHAQPACPVLQKPSILTCAVCCTALMKIQWGSSCTHECSSPGQLCCRCSVGKPSPG